MGQENNKIGLEKKNFAQIGTAQFYHFGRVEILQDQIHANRYFKQNFQFILQPQALEQYIRKLKQHNNECPYVIQIKYIQMKNIELCTSIVGQNAGCIDIYFQYLPITLEQLIKKQKNPFSQSEVWRIMVSLFSAIKFMNQKESYHGDLCPEFVYFDHRALKYKIFDSSYFTPLKSGYYRAQTQKIYCSPEILANISQKRTFPLYNHHVADTFSIGLILLYCMTLINPLSAYDHEKSEINYYFIENMVRAAHKNRYSEKLLQIVAKAVLLKNRPTAFDLLKDFDIEQETKNPINLNSNVQYQQINMNEPFENRKRIQNSQNFIIDHNQNANYNIKGSKFSLRKDEKDLQKSKQIKNGANHIRNTSKDNFY